MEIFQVCTRKTKSDKKTSHRFLCYHIGFCIIFGIWAKQKLRLLCTRQASSVETPWSACWCDLLRRLQLKILHGTLFPHHGQSTDPASDAVQCILARWPGHPPSSLCVCGWPYHDKLLWAIPWHFKRSKWLAKQKPWLPTFLSHAWVISLNCVPNFQANRGVRPMCGWVLHGGVYIYGQLSEILFLAILKISVYNFGTYTQVHWNAARSGTKLFSILVWRGEKKTRCGACCANARRAVGT